MITLHTIYRVPECEIDKAVRIANDTGRTQYLVYLHPGDEDLRIVTKASATGFLVAEISPQEDQEC